MIPLKRSMVFIDGSNLTTGCIDMCKRKGLLEKDTKTGKQIYTKKIAYDKLLKSLADSTDLIRGYFFDAAPEPITAGKQQIF